MSGFFTTTTLPHKHGALGAEFLASNRTPVVISAFLGFYAAYYSSFLTDDSEQPICPIFKN
jgi:hypothetical protein